MKQRSTRRANGTGTTPARSVRVSDEAWNRAQRRAAYEGVTMSHVLATFAEAYGNGDVSLPKLVPVYPAKPVVQGGGGDAA